MLDNQWIMPHSTFCLLRFSCHTNVECAVCFASAKYINKYMDKGGDCGTITFQDSHDEVKQYIDGRYITPPESVWRVLQFKLHGKRSVSILQSCSYFLHLKVSDQTLSLSKSIFPMNSALSLIHLWIWYPPVSFLQGKPMPRTCWKPGSVSDIPRISWAVHAEIYWRRPTFENLESSSNWLHNRMHDSCRTHCRRKILPLNIVDGHQRSHIVRRPENCGWHVVWILSWGVLETGSAGGWRQMEIVFAKCRWNSNGLTIAPSLRHIASLLCPCHPEGPLARVLSKDFWWSPPPPPWPGSHISYRWWGLWLWPAPYQWHPGWLGTHSIRLFEHGTDGLQLVQHGQQSALDATFMYQYWDLPEWLHQSTPGIPHHPKFKGLAIVPARTYFPFQF